MKLTEIEVPCAQLRECEAACTCDASSCGPIPLHDTQFDITFSGGLGSGSATLAVDGLHNLHLSPN